jgi:hypothetical protein
MLFGLAFGSGYNRTVPELLGVPRASAGMFWTVTRSPRFEKEVKFAVYFVPGDREAVGFIGDDRVVSAERDAMRRANLPQEEKAQ